MTKTKNITKTFGEKQKNVYNIDVKRLAKILFLMIFVASSVVGSSFVSPNYMQSQPTTTNGGQGGNSLDCSEKPKDADNNDDDTENLTTLETTYKSYSDYFVDFDISKATITEKDYTGQGTKSDPFVIRSTRGFLYLTNRTESGIFLGGKYLELGCDVVLNNEVFDKDGNIVEGDGVVYSFETFLIGDSVASIDGNNHSIVGAYQNRPNASWVQLFYTQIV